MRIGDGIPIRAIGFTLRPASPSHEDPGLEFSSHRERFDATRSGQLPILPASRSGLKVWSEWGLKSMDRIARSVGGKMELAANECVLIDGSSRQAARSRRPRAIREGVVVNSMTAVCDTVLGSFSLSHSHLAIRHLIKQLEQESGVRTPRQPLPTWLDSLIDRLSDCFEPFSGVARVGYEAFQSPSGWELTVFLGENEMVGGPEDGERNTVNFRFNLLELQGQFEQVHEFFWNAFPNSHIFESDCADLSFLTLDGTVAGHRIRLQVHAAPPDRFGPGIRQHSDGRVELTV